MAPWLLTEGVCLPGAGPAACEALPHEKRRVREGVAQPQEGAAREGAAPRMGRTKVLALEQAVVHDQRVAHVHLPGRHAALRGPAALHQLPLAHHKVARPARAVTRLSRRRLRGGAADQAVCRRSWVARWIGFRRLSSIVWERAIRRNEILDHNSFSSSLRLTSFASAAFARTAMRGRRDNI